MSRIQCILALALSAVMGFSLVGEDAAAHAAEPAPLRVLLTGDSIVHGFDGDYTWRYRLHKEFVRQGVAVAFVGSRHLPFVKPGYTSAQYLDPNFDRNHFAQGGSTLKQHAGWISDEVIAQQPDIIVFGAGVNDLRNGAQPETVNDRLRSWILAVRAVRPTVSIVISPVLDAVDPARPWLAERINDYNQLARGTVDALTTPQAPITMSETTRGWSVSSHTADNLHPNPTGETLIAQRIAETLRTLGYLSQAPDIYRWTSWNRQPRVRVNFTYNRATLSWDGQALTGARVWIRRAGRAARFPGTTYGGGTMTTSALAARSTYEFRVQLIRGRTATPLGPITRATVPAPRRPAAVARVTVTAGGVQWTRSARATKYRVQLKKRNARLWVTRQTTGLSLGAEKVVRARVWAVNAAGRSAVRLGVR